MLHRRQSVVFLICILTALVLRMTGQSVTSGDVTGAVSDPAHSAVPNATAILTNVQTNVSQTAMTGAQGTFRFAFVQPGTYKLSVTASGFGSQERSGIVATPGQPTAVNFQLQVSAVATSVVVTESAEILQTENADATTHFSAQQVENMPNPGGDITYVAQTAPGVIMNTQGGYGNFVANGMPGTSNLFSINGVNDNDPFFGTNNSGASNLLLGSNDIAEANVINNAYSGQYGQYAGSQITYITKSGSNSFHGDALYTWNGRALNANQFFSNASGLPRPFNNFNQWQTGLSGPIWKNRTFFDVDYEGLRNLLPTSANLNQIPSPQFEAATLANLGTNGNAAEIPFYNKLFSVYNNAPGASGAVPVSGGGCQGFTGLAAGVPCALQFRSTPGNTNKEYLWSARVDHTLNDKDRFYVRVSRDNGFQPSFTSPFGAIFNAVSNQPQMTGQISETHTFGPNTVNEFKGSALFYAAVFEPADAAAASAAFPTFIIFSGNPFTATGVNGQPGPFYYPQGRRVFQYQILDDLSQIHGKHTFRAGFSWLHDTITVLDFQGVNGPVTGSITTNLADFFAGGGPNSSLLQTFPSSPEEAIRLNTLGGYVADDWKVTDRLTVSLNLRMEHYANPTCDAHCFARLKGTFAGVPDSNAANTPYNQFILADQKNAYNNTQSVIWEPRVGIAWRPSHGDRTVIRTGAGIFADQLAGGLTEDAAFNSPGFNAFTIGNGTLAPGVPGSLFSTAAQANQALLSQFRSGGSFNSISQSVPGFAPPNFFNFPTTFNQPKYYKWNFEIEQALGARMMLSVNYSGMHGSHIPVGDEGLNGYCPPSACPNGFAGLPAAPPNPALGQVTQYLSAGNANYNGLTVSLQRQLASGIAFNLNYTWSHSLDDVSNGGVTNTPFSILATNASVTAPQNPFNIRANYGSSDYDVRHYFSATLMIADALRRAGFHWGPNLVFGGWMVSTNWFFRTGLPFTIVDTAALGTLFGYNYAGAIFASPTANVPGSCLTAINNPCLSTSQFAPSAAVTGFPTGFGTIGRNSVYGPRFFDVDIAVMKNIPIGEHIHFSFGAQAYNAFNHTNLDQPAGDIANPQFGLTIAAVGPPTSILGSFVGAGSSPRFVAIKGAIRF